MNKNLTFDKVAQALKIANSLYNLNEDIGIYNKNIAALQSGDFEQIKNCLSQSLDRYGRDISQLSCLTHVGIQNYPVLTYEVAFTSLVYITNNIPFYVAYDKLKEKGMEFLLNKLLFGSDTLSETRG